MYISDQTIRRMDVSSFSDDSFDVKEWVNVIFRLPEAQGNRDAFSLSTVAKLQLLVQKMNNTLEETSQQVLQNLPRIVRDLESLHQEAAVLQDKMVSVKQEIEKVERDTAQSMETLVWIDEVKTRMQATSEALKEADNWTTLASDVGEVFEGGDIEAIASRLLGMQHSLQILTHVPDYIERKTQLETWKNRLEALASPRVIAAFTARSIDGSRFFSKIFVDMDRLPQLLKYYQSYEKTQIIEKWKSIVEADQEGGVAEWLTKFYDCVTSNWHDQMRWCNQVFPRETCPELLLELYTEVLLNLDPSLELCVDAGLKQCSQEPLQFLIELKNITGRFVKSVESLALDNTSTSTHLPFLHSVYRPYGMYIVKYQVYEEACLLKLLSTTKLTRDELLDAIQELSKSVSRVGGWIMEASTRCDQFSEGCAYDKLGRVLLTFFSSYLGHYRTVLRRIEERNSSNEDWDMFQQCLLLIQTVGDLILELEKCDKNLTSNLSGLARRYLMKNTQELSHTKFDSILLDRDSQKNYHQFLEKFLDSQASFMEDVLHEVHLQCAEVLNTTFNAIFSPFAAQLNQVSSMEMWAQKGASGSLAANLPSFSLSPLEYITQVGQYLMMLPQHLEPFVLQENPGLSRAFSVADLPYGTKNEQWDERNPADILLNAIASGVGQTYADSILCIPELPSATVKQLVTDIDYLGNILDDLGVPPCENLQNLKGLLKMSPDDYWTTTRGFPPRLVAAVRQMRNITPKM